MLIFFFFSIAVYSIALILSVYFWWNEGSGIFFFSLFIFHFGSLCLSLLVSFYFPPSRRGSFLRLPPSGVGVVGAPYLLHLALYDVLILSSPSSSLYFPITSNR